MNPRATAEEWYGWMIADIRQGMRYRRITLALTLVGAMAAGIMFWRAERQAVETRKAMVELVLRHPGQWPPNSANPEKK